MNNQPTNNTPTNDIGSPSIKQPDYAAELGFASINANNQIDLSLPNTERVIDSEVDFIQSIRAKSTNDVNSNLVFDPLAVEDMIEKRVSTLMGDFDKSNKIDYVSYDVDIRDAYDRLSDGSYVRRYENYIHGTNNEERLAKQQTSSEKWWNGIKKMVGKTALNILDGTVGTIYSIPHAISEGSFSALWDNDFSNWVSDVNKTWDYEMPNYYTQHEKEMGFIESLGTANFWANDLTQGISFMVGALGTEAVWAGVTGGASLGTSLARLSLKQGAKGTLKGIAKGISKTAGQNAGKAFYRNNLKLMNQYLRSVHAKTAGDMLNTIRFGITSSGFEASKEAINAYNESLESFTNSYKRVYGRTPTVEEYSDFINEAANKGNWVYGANVAIVGSSNILQFGSYFGVGKGLNRALDKSLNRLVGIGYKFNPAAKAAAQGAEEVAETTAKGAGKKFLEGASIPLVDLSTKANVAQKIAGNALGIGRRVVPEGAEEGNQKVVSDAYMNYLAAKFNPDSVRKSVSLTDEVLKSFQDVYSSKEGWKEIGLGMMIGLFGQAGQRTHGRRTPFGIGSYSAERAYNSRMVEMVNLNTTTMNEAVRNTLNRMKEFNAQMTNEEKAEQEYNKGNVFEASKAWDVAQYAKMNAEYAAGLLDEGGSNFIAMMKNASAQEIADQYGLTVEEAEQFKSESIEEYKKNLDAFKKAKRISEALAPQSNIEGDNTNYIDDLALNIYLGAKAGDRASKLADEIDNAIRGKGGFASAVKIYSNLKEEDKKVAEELLALQEEKEKLEKEYEELRKSFTSYSREKGTRVEENKGVAEEINKGQDRIEEIISRIKELDVRKIELEERLSAETVLNNFPMYGEFNTFGNDADSDAVVSNDEIVNSVKQIKAIEKYRQTLNKENSVASQKLEFLLNEYTNNVKAYRDFNIVYEKMVDPRFVQRYTSFGSNLLAKIFKNVGVKYDDKNMEVTDLDPDIKQYEELINQYENLTEDEKFTIKTLNRIKNSRFTNFDIGNPIISETIPPDELEEILENGEISDDLKNRLARKSLNDEDLTPNEAIIFDEFQGDILLEAERIQNEEGDSIDKAKGEDNDNVVPRKEFDNDTLINRLKNLIEKIRAGKKYLEDFDVDKADTINKPTQSEYDEFGDLALEKSRLEELEGKNLSPKKQDRYEELRDKINEWGRLEGTLDDKGILLADLIEQLIHLQNLENSDTIQSLPLIEELADLLDLEDFRPTNRNGNYDNLQSYDKAVVSKNSNGETAIANISLNGILNIISSNLPNFKVKRGNKNIESTDGVYSIDDIKKGQTYTISFDSNGKNITFKVRIGSGGNILLKPSAVKIVNENTNLEIRSINQLSTTNYFDLKQEDGNGNLVPVPTDFSFEDGRTTDPNAIWDSKEGDMVRVKVNLDSPYTQKLINEYNKTVEKGDKKAAKRALDMIEQEMLIQAEDSEGNLIGVFKGISDSKASSKDHNLLVLRQIRKAALQEFLQKEDKSGLLNFELQVRIKQIYLGLPNFTVREENGNFMVQNNEFTDSSVRKVKDIGYMLNGKIYLRNGTKEYSSYPYMAKMRTDTSYKNKRIPLIVFEFKGRNIAYPVSLKTTKIDMTGNLMDIIRQDISLNDKIMQMNTLLHEYNVDLNKYGFTSENVTDMNHIQAVNSQLEKSADYFDVTNWTKRDNGEMGEILKGQALINIDIAGTPLHSPKVKLDYSKIDGLPNLPNTGTNTKEDVSSKMKKEAKKQQDEGCGN